MNINQTVITIITIILCISKALHSLSKSRRRRFLRDAMKTVVASHSSGRGFNPLSVSSSLLSDKENPVSSETTFTNVMSRLRHTHTYTHTKADKQTKCRVQSAHTSHIHRFKRWQGRDVDSNSAPTLRTQVIPYEVKIFVWWEVSANPLKYAIMHKPTTTISFSCISPKRAGPITCPPSTPKSQSKECACEWPHMEVSVHVAISQMNAAILRIQIYFQCAISWDSCGKKWKTKWHHGHQHEVEALHKTQNCSFDKH